MKTILLPREWNSPDEPPTNDVDLVMVKTKMGNLYVAKYYDQVKLYGAGSLLFSHSDIEGWAAIVQQ